MVRTIEIEPTPEFDQTCTEALQNWLHGDIPFKDITSLMNRMLQQAVDDDHVANQARAEHLLGYIQHYRGNLNTSIQHYERSRALYRRIGNLRRAAVIDLNQGENYRFKGDFNKALYLYRSAYRAAQDFDNVELSTMAALNEGLLLLTTGQDQPARSILETALALSKQWTDSLEQLPALLCEVYYGLATSYLREGNLPAACDAAHMALETALQSDQPPRLGIAYRTAGEVVTALIAHQIEDDRLGSNPDEYFRTSLTAFREINAEAEMARTMYAHALSMGARGRRTTAARKLQQVMMIFTNLDMVDDAARAAEAQLALTDDF